MTNFGATFKKARESKGISINQISAETRISVRFLLAIESEEFHLLPGGVFNRGFIRAYAEKVDLDPDQAIADYERLGGVPETSEIPPTPIATPRKREKQLYSVAIGGLIPAQIVPRHTSLADLWKDAAEFIDPVMTLTYPGNLTHAHLVTPEGVAAALQRLYEDRAHRDALAEAAYRNATRAALSWKAIAERWRQLFDELLTSW